MKVESYRFCCVLLDLLAHTQSVTYCQMELASHHFNLSPLLIYRQSLIIQHCHFSNEVVLVLQCILFFDILLNFVKSFFGKVEIIDFNWILFSLEMRLFFPFLEIFVSWKVPVCHACKLLFFFIKYVIDDLLQRPSPLRSFMLLQLF